ncbi:hypothetical protein K493DRAFT_345133 [Basidiobolus meristosporus CBS 931.73]|uniref:Uncharacterized protein n=1 Tax=Basidiobolus meristosporus CBS 931.73 TaxID=1314790 RepID=A0A1Y1Z4M0_9FUNG|nr:hypothetical protein K493DRAFT_345133 [Basidiobolus meristosporus CBS 931.73]|eukprot:ORY05211.1 hypothetical protein K493DRAFT_345133 [Basidiobolus meristosporus CBS 931.73]
MMQTQQQNHRLSLSDIKETIVKDHPMDKEAVHPPSVFDKPITISQGQAIDTTAQEKQDEPESKLPSKEEFENALSDNERAMALYEALLDTHKKIVEAVEISSGGQAQPVVPEHWSVQVDPRSNELKKCLQEYLFAPESNFFLPEDDAKLVEIVRQWDILPDIVFASDDSTRKLVTWMRTTFTVERAAIRKKVLGIFMSMRKHRGFDIVSLTREIVPDHMPVKLHMVRKVLLLRTVAKDNGTWHNKDEENQFWEHFLKEYSDISQLNPDQPALGQNDVYLTDGSKWKGVGSN